MSAQYVFLMFKIICLLELSQLAHIAEMEVKHRCSQALEMGFRLGGLAKLFAQDWEGDITIVMPATFAQVFKVYCTATS